MKAYLDHAATSPMREAVLTRYADALREAGNPASTHGHGQAARERLEAARERIAAGLGCDAAELILTSGGTESINLALKGIYWARHAAGERPVILVAEGEHHATMEAAEWLRDHEGAELQWLPLDDTGRLDPATLSTALERAGAHRVALVSFIWANSEIGTIQPVAELCSVAEAAGVPVHVDAVAALGQVPIDFHGVGAAALSVSAHKIGGPVGIGALLLRRDVVAEPLQHGGNQQRFRSGTQNAAAAVAFATALELTDDPEHDAHLVRARDALITGVRAAVPDAVLRGADPGTPGARLPGNAHFTFPGCRGDSLLFLLDAAGVSASTGSACQAGVDSVSHVLLALGIAADDAAGALRFTVGPDTRQDEIDLLIAALPDAVERARRAGTANG